MSKFVNSVQCSKGHWYDPSISSTCPLCAAEAAAAQGYEGVTGAVDEVGATEAVNGTQDYGSTEPVGMNFGGNSQSVEWGGETQPADHPFKEEDFNDMGLGGDISVEDYGATMPASMNGIPGFAPVTGWLVCIDGAAKGTDYRIHTDYNFIGRDPNMDICIAGDNRISRDRHAVIVYDPQERMFFFGPQNAKSVVRLNNRPVIGQAELKSHDVLTIGSTKLLFVPLCDERFNWDE